MTIRNGFLPHTPNLKFNRRKSCLLVQWERKSSWCTAFWMKRIFAQFARAARFMNCSKNAGRPKELAAQMLANCTTSCAKCNFSPLSWKLLVFFQSCKSSSNLENFTSDSSILCFRITSFSTQSLPTHHLLWPFLVFYRGAVIRSK